MRCSCDGYSGYWERPALGGFTAGGLLRCGWAGAGCDGGWGTCDPGDLAVRWARWDGGAVLDEGRDGGVVWWVE